MDPLSAIGLASNIVAFVEFTSKLVSGTYEIYSSNARMTDEHADLAKVIQDVHAVTRRLSYSPVPAATDDENALLDLVERCRKLSEDLIRALKRLQAKNPKSKLESFRVAWRSMREKGNLDSLEKRIDRLRRQILDRILIMMSEDTSSIYKLLQQSMKTSETLASEARKELQELKETVLSLVKKLRLDEVEDQLKSKKTTDPVRTAGASGASLVDVRTILLRVSEVTATISREDWILNQLSFDEMHNREMSIEDAHAKTFRWLLYDQSEEEPDESASDEEASEEDQGKGATGLEHGRNEAPEPRLSSSEPWPENDSDLPVSSETSEAHEAAETLGEGSTQSDIEEQETEERKEARLKFLSWLNSGSGIFHISGKLGSGKSTLMKFLSEEARTKQELQKWTGDKRLVFSQFFFWASGSPIQRSLEGLYRGILWETLRDRPSLMREVFPRCWDADFRPAGDRVQDRPFRKSELMAAFELLMKSETVFNKHKICFFIDGLDEFDGDHWKLARALKIWSDTGDLKICVSSRPHNEFVRTFSDPDKQLRLHELTRQDIKKFVEDEFEHDERFLSVYAHSERYARLIHSLVAKAEGVFLWVRLATREILSGIGNSYSISQLEEELRQLPEGLEALFRRMLTSIRKPDRMRAARALLIMTSEYSFRGMNRLIVMHAVADELSDANYDAKLLYSATLGPPITRDDVERMTHTIQDRLNSRCKGLIQVQSTRSAYLEFIHRSIYEFLVMRDVKAELLQLAGPSFDPAKFMCIAFLRLLKGPYKLAEKNQNAEPEVDPMQLIGQHSRFTSGSYVWLLEMLALPILVIASRTQTDTSCPCPRELEVVSESLLKLSACLPATPAPTESLIYFHVGHGVTLIKFLSDSNDVEAQGRTWLALCALLGARRFVLDTISQLPDLLGPSARVNLLLLATVGAMDPDFDFNASLAQQQSLVVCLLERGISPNWPLSGPSQFVSPIPSSPPLMEEYQTTWTIFLRLVGAVIRSRHELLANECSYEVYTYESIDIACKFIGHYLESAADPTVVFVGYQIVLPKEGNDASSPNESSEILVGPTYLDLGQLVEVWDPPNKKGLLALWDRKHQSRHTVWDVSLNSARSFWKSKPVPRIPQIETESLRSSPFLVATVVSTNELPRVEVSEVERWARTTEGSEWLLETFGPSLHYNVTASIRI